MFTKCNVFVTEFFHHEFDEYLHLFESKKMFINLSIINPIFKAPQRVGNGLSIERNYLNKSIKLFQLYFSLKQTKYHLENKFQPFMGLLSSDSYDVPKLRSLQKIRIIRLLCAQLKNFYYTFQTENQTLHDHFKASAYLSLTLNTNQVLN